MAGADGMSRIRDVVRDSKILRDALAKMDRKQDFRRTRCSVHGVDRDLPRKSSGEQQEGRHISFTSSFDEFRYGFHNYNEKEDPFHGFYHRYGGLIVKFQKNLPVFDGFWRSDDLMSWIGAIEDFFEEINPPEHVKCKIVWYKMKGAAYYWWKVLQNDRISEGKNFISSWPTMKQLLLKRFMSSTCSTKVHAESDSNKHSGTTDLRNFAASEMSYEGDGHSKEMSEVKPTKCVMEFPMLISNETTKEGDQIEEAAGTTVVTHLKKPACSDTCVHLDADNLQPKQITLLGGSSVLNFEFDQTPMGESQLKSFVNCSPPTTKNAISMLSKFADQIELMPDTKEDDLNEFGFLGVTLANNVGMLLNSSQTKPMNVGTTRHPQPENKLRGIELLDLVDGLKNGRGAAKGICDVQIREMQEGIYQQLISATWMLYTCQVIILNLASQCIILLDKALSFMFDPGGKWQCKVDMGKGKRPVLHQATSSPQYSNIDFKKEKHGKVSRAFNGVIEVCDSEVCRQKFYSAEKWCCISFQLGLNAFPLLTHLAFVSDSVDMVDIGSMWTVRMANVSAYMTNMPTLVVLSDLSVVVYAFKGIKKILNTSTSLMFKACGTLDPSVFGKDTMDKMAANMGRGTLNNRVQTPCVSHFIYLRAMMNHVYQLAGRIYCEGRYCSRMRFVVVLAVTLVALLALNFKVHMAIVFNEYGGTTWIVTLDDVVEEIVGEVYKEIDSRMEECSQRLQALPPATGSRKSQHTTGARVAIERLILAEYEVNLTATNEVEYENTPTCRQALKLEFIMFFGNSIAPSHKRTAEMKLSLPAMTIIFFDEADQMLAADGLHTLNLELMFHVTISFDPGGIAYSSETWKLVSSIRRVHLFQCSFWDVAAPRGPFGIRKSIGKMNDEHVEDKKMELQEMVKIFQQGNIATFMAVLSAYSMQNQIAHFCDMVLNMENDGLALDVVFYIELIHGLFTQKRLHVIVGGCIDMHDLNWDFMWVQAMFLELLSVQMASCICSLGEIFLRMFREGLILGLLQHQTRGRGTPLEGWNDDKNANMEMKQIAVEISVVIIDSCGNVLWKNGQSWESLKLFHNVVNGLDPPVRPTKLIWPLHIRFPRYSLLLTRLHWTMHKQEGPNSRTSLLFWGQMEMMQWGCKKYLR